MQTSAYNPNNFKYTARPQLPVVGEVLFAASWLLAIGALNLFYAIAVLADSDIFITTASWLVGDARPWGWLMLIIGLLQMTAAVGVLLTRWWAIWVGLLSVAAHVAAGLMFFGDEPWIALALLVLDLIVLVCLIVLVRAPGRSAP